MATMTVPSWAVRLTAPPVTMSLRWSPSLLMSASTVLTTVLMAKDPAPEMAVPARAPPAPPMEPATAKPEITTPDSAFTVRPPTMFSRAAVTVARTLLTTVVTATDAPTVTAVAPPAPREIAPLSAPALAMTTVSSVAVTVTLPPMRDLPPEARSAIWATWASTLLTTVLTVAEPARAPDQPDPAPPVPAPAPATARDQMVASDPAVTVMLPAMSSVEPETWAVISFTTVLTAMEAPMATAVPDSLPRAPATLSPPVLAMSTVSSVASTFSPPAPPVATLPVFST